MAATKFLASELPAPQSSPPAPRKSRFWRNWLIGMVILVLLHLRVSQHRSSSSDRRRITYPGETIEWEGCGRAGRHELECAEISVPMDHFNATNSADKTFIIPLIRLRSENATRNLLINPGGPGGSGMDFVHRQGEQIRTLVGDGFHIVSFDPRGVNGSRPMASCYPDEEARKRLAPVRDAKAVEDSVDMYAWSSGYAKACTDAMGELGSYINTPQTAADMNSVLDALGEEDLYYWGFSYGTLLGQTYATLFPERCKRVIIDGVVNQFEWYNDLIAVGALEDTDRVLEGFADECFKAGPNCSLSSVVPTKEDLLAKLFALGESLKTEQLSVYVDPSTWGSFSADTLWSRSIFPRLYKPAAWHELADRLASLVGSGNATDAFLTYGLREPFGLKGEAHDLVQFNDARSGPDYWPQGRGELLDMLLPLYSNGSVFMRQLNKYHYIKQKWLMPRTHTFEPSNHVETAFPLLVMSMSHDPVCPVSGAKIARDAFIGARLVQLRGYGHCTLSMESACVVDRLREYLYEGKLPEDDVVCEADNGYFEPPEEKAQIVEDIESMSEKQRIREAQRVLAREIEWQDGWI